MKGLCGICGKGGKLTEEHIPPQCAGNLRGLALHTFQDWIDAGGDPETLPNPQLRQKGTLWATLCSRCNNEVLGQWYVPDFCRFVQGTMRALARIDRDTLQKLPQQSGDWIRIGTGPSMVRPLSIVKTIVGMVLALNAEDDPAFRVRHSKLVECVLDREAPLPEPYRAYMAIELGDYGAFAPTIVRVHDDDIVTFSGIDYPPLAYILTFDERQPDVRPFLPCGGLSNFAQCKYTDVTSVQLDLLVSRKRIPLVGEYETAG